jgi:hypothetical protein
LILRAALKFLANFTGWATGLLASLDAWWQALFGPRRPRAGPEEEVEESAAAARNGRPFSAYHNPFESGAGRRPPEELVRYSFEALEALARERGLGRHPDETPQEFAARLGGELPALDADARHLAGLYARAAYAPGRLPRSAVEAVKQFWKRLAAAADAPLSA